VEPINKVIERILAEGKLGNSAQVAELWGQWGEIVGESIAEHCVPEKITEGKLYIRVDSAGWCQQLDMLKEELKEKINRKQGRPNIQKIVLRSGTIGEQGVSRSL
jgi:predicted nucleic acid-binding Zn ribbon protein